MTITYRLPNGISFVNGNNDVLRSFTRIKMLAITKVNIHILKVFSSVSKNQNVFTLVSLNRVVSLQVFYDFPRNNRGFPLGLFPYVWLVPHK